MWKRICVLALVLGVSLLVSAEEASAGHSWNNYHWARTANPFTLKVVNSLTPNWDPIGSAVNSDWSAPDVLDLRDEAGGDATSDRKRCKAVSGKVRACNADYGFNGWLGIASIWLNGGGHIVQGTTKQNDSYLNTSTYSAYKRHVLCQEVGHTLGLGHTSGADTCMNDNLGAVRNSPNAHDYEQLVAIYSHTDGSNTVAASLADPLTLLGRHGAAEDDDPDDALPPGAGPKDGKVFQRDLGGGRKVITFVFWVPPGAPGAR